MKSLKIVSDGSSRGTEVYDAESGEKIHGITAVSWDISPGGIATCRVELLSVEFEGLGTGNFYVRHPTGKDLREVKEITFLDGEKLEF